MIRHRNDYQPECVIMNRLIAENVFVVFPDKEPNAPMHMRTCDLADTEGIVAPSCFTLMIAVLLSLHQFVAKVTQTRTNATWFCVPLYDRGTVVALTS